MNSPLPSLSLPSPAIAAILGSLEIASASDPGREPSKQVNEDSALARATRHGFLAVVCDGMGGHVGGREASQLAISTIFRVFDETPEGTAPGNLLSHAIREANSAVFARGQHEPELRGMGSTCVAILVHPGGVEVAHVGDSRAYLLTQQQVYQVTKDHSLVQRLVDANMITPEEAPNHPNANQITNALGMRPDVDVELRAHPFAVHPGDTFVLCSDGFSDECGPRDLLETLAPQPTCDAVATQLIDLANARGGHDNITVVVVRFQGGAPFAIPSAASTQVKTPTAFPVDPTLGLTTPQPTRTLDQAPSPISGGTGTIPPPAGPPPFQPPPPPYRSAPPTPIAPRARKKGPLIALVVGVFVLVGVAVAWAVASRSEHREGVGNNVVPTEPPEEDVGRVRRIRKLIRADTGIQGGLDVDDEVPPPEAKSLRNPRAAGEPPPAGHSSLPPLPAARGPVGGASGLPPAAGLPGGIGEVIKDHTIKSADVPPPPASMPPPLPSLPAPLPAGVPPLPAIPERTK